MAFLRNENLIHAATQAASTYAHVWTYGLSHYRKFDEFPSNRSGLHMTARYGLVDLTKRLIDECALKRIEIDLEDSSCRTALSLAAEIWTRGNCKAAC